MNFFYYKYPSKFNDLVQYQKTKNTKPSHRQTKQDRESKKKNLKMFFLVIESFPSFSSSHYIRLIESSPSSYNNTISKKVVASTVLECFDMKDYLISLKDKYGDQISVVQRMCGETQQLFPDEQFDVNEHFGNINDFIKIFSFDEVDQKEEGEKNIVSPDQFCVKAKLHNKRYLLSFNYNKDLITEIRTIKNRFYNVETKTWSIPENTKGELINIVQKLGIKIIFQ